jgi:hypothetical protein
MSDQLVAAYITHNRQPAFSPTGSEHKPAAGERLQTYALQRAANGNEYLQRY